MTTNTVQPKGMGLTAKILTGMVAGILTGFLFKIIMGESGDFTITFGEVTFSAKGFFVDGIFHIGGQIFVNSLKMLVVPLVFISLVCGTCSLSDPKKLGRLGGKSIGLYLLTTAIAITLAMTFALLINPGEGVNMPSTSTFDAKQAPTLVDVIINMFPTNPINAMSSGNMLQVIVFALLFGIAMALSGEAGKRLTASRL